MISSPRRTSAASSVSGIRFTRKRSSERSAVLTCLTYIVDFVYRLWIGDQRPGQELQHRLSGTRPQPEGGPQIQFPKT